MALHQPMASSKIDSLYAAIDSLFDAGQISDGTYQFAADLIQDLDTDEQDKITRKIEILKSITAFVSFLEILILINSMKILI